MCKIKHDTIKNPDMILKRGTFISFFVPVATIFLSLSIKSVFAQEGFFAARDNLIFAALNHVEAKQKAVTDAMMEAQIKLAESKPGQKIQGSKEAGFSFRDVVSRAHPYIFLNTTFDNNLDNNRDPKSSFINTLTPGLKMNFNSKTATLNLDTSVNNKFYNQRPKSDAQNATVSLLSNFLINRYTLAIADTYYNNYGPAEQISSDDSTYDSNVQWSNSFASSLSRQFNRLGFNAAYKHWDYQYRGDAAFESNYSVNEGSLQQTFSVSKKTSILFEYLYSNTAYKHELDTSKDFYYNLYTLSLTKVLTPKITGLIKASYKDVDYKDEGDYKEGIYSLKLSYQASTRTDFSFNYDYTPHDDPDNTDYTIENEFKLTLNHRLAFNPKFRVSLVYDAQMINYPKLDDRVGHSNTYSWNFTLNYFFRQWLDFSLNYMNKDVCGNNVSKYRENIVSLKTQARF